MASQFHQNSEVFASDFLVTASHVFVISNHTIICFWKLNSFWRFSRKSQEMFLYFTVFYWKLVLSTTSTKETSLEDFLVILKWKLQILRHTLVSFTSPKVQKDRNISFFCVHITLFSGFIEASSTIVEIRFRTTIFQRNGVYNVVIK